MFREHLQTAVEAVPGAIAGILMGYDGIAVDSYAAPKVQGPNDIQTIGMEFSFVLSQVRKAAEALDVGTPDEVIIRSEGLTIVTRAISPDYFMALALTPSGNSGKGRYLLRILTPKLQAEL